MVTIFRRDSEKRSDFLKLIWTRVISCRQVGVSGAIYNPSWQPDDISEPKLRPVTSLENLTARQKSAYIRSAKIWNFISMKEISHENILTSDFGLPCCIVLRGSGSADQNTEGTRVRVRLGNTPSTVKLPKGPHKITLKKGDLTWQRDVDVRPGSSLTINGTLAKS